MKNPGLKPCRFGLGFRGMNAPAPSGKTNNSKGRRPCLAGVVEELRCIGLEFALIEGKFDGGESVQYHCLQEHEGVRLRVVA
jgi:hypothetical protein